MDLPITVQDAAGLATVRPVTGGLPIAEGAAPENTTFSLRDAQGNAVPLQTTVLARWPDGSAHAHLTGEGDPLIGDVGLMINYIGDWERYLALDVEEVERQRLRLHRRIGRPLGDSQFVVALEQSPGRFILKRRRDPKGLRTGKTEYSVPEITRPERGIAK